MSPSEKDKQDDLIDEIDMYVTGLQEYQDLLSNARDSVLLDLRGIALHLLLKNLEILLNQLWKLINA